MNITPQLILRMTPQEKEIYIAHMEKRHREEAEKLEAEKLALRSYRLGLIDDILRMSDKFDRDSLSKLSVRTLERIFDNI